MRSQCLKFSVFLICAFPLFSCSATYAAEFLNEKDIRGNMLVFLKGNIEKGDSGKFESIVSSALSVPFSGSLVLVLDSPGGDVVEAFKIGSLVRELMITTRTSATAFAGWWEGDSMAGGSLPEGRPWGGMRKLDGDLQLGNEAIGRCWSACTMVFASGVVRQAVDNFDKKDKSLRVPTIGVHRPKMPNHYFSSLSFSDAREAHEGMLDKVERFLLEMGASSEFISRTMNTPPHQIDLIDLQELDEMLPRAEPFFEDWVTAKCGRNTDILNSKELEIYFRAVEKIIVADYGFGYGEHDGVVWRYKDNYDSDLKFDAGEIVNRVFEFDDFVRFCSAIIVKKHQFEWLRAKIDR